MQIIYGRLNAAFEFFFFNILSLDFFHIVNPLMPILALLSILSISNSGGRDLWRPFLISTHVVGHQKSGCLGLTIKNGHLQ